MVDMTLNELQTKVKVIHFATNWFLADRTNGRAIGTVLRLSVCNVMYCG